MSNTLQIEDLKMAVKKIADDLDALRKNLNGLRTDVDGDLRRARDEITDAASAVKLINQRLDALNGSIDSRLTTAEESISKFRDDTAADLHARLAVLETGLREVKSAMSYKEANARA